MLLRIVSSGSWLHGIAGLLLCIASAAHAGGIDHRVAYDDRGIWSPKVQSVFQDGAPVLVLATALWLGDDDRLGHTSWQTVDSMLIGTVTAAAMKRAFSRERPSTTDDPNHWFKGKGNASFPSGDTMWITTAVTPYVLEYAKDRPWVLALEILPIYTAVARVKNRDHWQTDVLASLAIGSAIGYYAHSRTSALSVMVLPHGVTVGWQKRF